MEVSRLWEDTSGSDTEDGGYSDLESTWLQRGIGVTPTNEQSDTHPTILPKSLNRQPPELPATPAQLPLATTAPSPTTPFPTPQHAVSSVAVSQLLVDGYSGTIPPSVSAVRAFQPGPTLRSPTNTPPTTPLRPATPASTPVRGDGAPALGANTSSTGNTPATGAGTGTVKQPSKSLTRQLPPEDLVAALERELAEIEHKYIHTRSSDPPSATRRSSPGSRPRSRGSTPGAVSSGGGAASVVCACGAVLAVPVYDDGVYGTGVYGQPVAGGGAGSEGVVSVGHPVQGQASHAHPLHTPLHGMHQLDQAAGALQRLSLALEAEAGNGGQAVGAAGRGAGRQGGNGGQHVSGRGFTLRMPPPSPAVISGGAAYVEPVQSAGMGPGPAADMDAAAWGRKTAALQGRERNAHAAAGAAPAPYASTDAVGTRPHRGSKNGGSGGGGSAARSLLLEFEALAEEDWQQQQQRQHLLSRAFAGRANFSSAPSSAPLSQGHAGGLDGVHGPPSLAGAFWTGGSGGEGGDDGVSSQMGGTDARVGQDSGAGGWGRYLQGFSGARGRPGWSLESEVASTASEVTLRGMVVQGAAEASHRDNGAPELHTSAGLPEVSAFRADSEVPAGQLSGQGKGPEAQGSVQAAGLGALYPGAGVQGALGWPGPSANASRDPGGMESAPERDRALGDIGQGSGGRHPPVGLRDWGAGDNVPPATSGRPGQLHTVQRHRHHHERLGRSEQPAVSVLSYSQQSLHTQSVRQELGKQLQEEEQQHQRHMQPVPPGNECEHPDHWHSNSSHCTHRRYQPGTDHDRNQTAHLVHTQCSGRDPQLLDSLPDGDLEAMAGELLRTQELALGEGWAEGVGEVQQGCVEGSELGSGGADCQPVESPHGGMAGAGGMVDIPGGSMWEAEAVGTRAAGRKWALSEGEVRAGSVGGWADSALEEAERSARRTALSALHARLDELQARYDSKRRMLRSLRLAAASSPSERGHDAAWGGSGGALSARRSAGGWDAPGVPGVPASGGGPRPSPSLAAILAHMASPSRSPRTRSQPAGRAAAAAGDSDGAGGGGTSVAAADGGAIGAAAAASSAAVSYGRSIYHVDRGSASTGSMPQLRTPPTESCPAQPAASITPTSNPLEHTSAASGQQAPTHTSHSTDSRSQGPPQAAPHTTDLRDGQDPHRSTHQHQHQHHGDVQEEHEVPPGRRLPPPASRQELQELLRLFAEARSLPQLRPLDRVLLTARLEEALALRMSHGPPQEEHVWRGHGGLCDGERAGWGQQGLEGTGDVQGASSRAEGELGAWGDETARCSGAVEVGEVTDGSGRDGMVEGLQVEGESSQGLMAGGRAWGMYDRPPRRGYARIWAGKHPGGAARARACSGEGPQTASGPDASLQHPVASSAPYGGIGVSHAAAGAEIAVELGVDEPACAGGSPAQPAPVAHSQPPPGGWCGGLGSPVLDGTLDAVHRVVAPNACLARALTLNWQVMRDRALRLQQQQQRDGAKGVTGSGRRRGSRYALSPRDVLEEAGSSSSSS